MDQTAAGVLGPIVIIPTAIAGVLSFVGFNIASKSEGVGKVLGYVLGIGAGLGAVAGLMMFAGVLSLDAIEKSFDKAPTLTPPTFPTMTPPVFPEPSFSEIEERQAAFS